MIWSGPVAFDARSVAVGSTLAVAARGAGLRTVVPLAGEDAMAVRLLPPKTGLKACAASADAPKSVAAAALAARIWRWEGTVDTPVDCDTTWRLTHSGPQRT